MKILILCCLFFTFVYSHEVVNENNDEDKLGRWRGAVQQLVLGLSRGTFGEEFTPEKFSKRNLTIALNQQMAKFRGQVARSISQAVGTTVSLCPPIEISDQAIMGIRKELKQLGWTVEWKTLAEHYSSSDPINFDVMWPQHLKNPCNGNRRAFRVEVPIKEEEEEEEKEKGK